MHENKKLEEFKALDFESKKKVVEFEVSEFVKESKPKSAIKELISKHIASEKYLVSHFSYQILGELDKEEYDSLYAVAYNASLSGFTGFLQKIDKDAGYAEELTENFARKIASELSK